MDKNLLWAVTLSIAIYALWFGVIEKRYIKPIPPAARMGAPSPEGSRSPLPKAAPRQAQMPAAAAPAAPATPVEAVDLKVLEAESVPVAAPNAKLLIHPRGAAVVSCSYRGPLGLVELVHEPTPGLFATWPQLRFQREAAEGGGARFSAALPGGLLLVKEYLPESQGALPRIRLRLSNPTRKPLESGEWTMTVGPGLGTVASEQKENPSVWRAIRLAAGKKVVDALKPGPVTGDMQWVGVDNRYFLAAVLPDFQDFASVESAKPPLVTLRAKSVVIAPDGEKVWDIPYYLGAKGYTWLGRYNAGLEKSVDFGWFKDLGRPLLRMLSWLERQVGNWGWAIVIMTFFIQALLFPLTYKSMKAMGAMKRLQPEIAKLQQKYAKDPQRLNAEMMDLYKKSGANPLGGCLPLMLQMPVFIALFNTLRNAWELHGAPWVFWVHDLSAKDPYYVLPIIMGVVMFLQNRMNPAATSDPTQKTMMTWMPVIFTFMFLSTPAGLVLYWLTSSIISASLQLGLKRHFEAA